MSSGFHRAGSLPPPPDAIYEVCVPTGKAGVFCAVQSVPSLLLALGACGTMNAHHFVSQRSQYFIVRSPGNVLHTMVAGELARFEEHLGFVLAPYDNDT